MSDLKKAIRKLQEVVNNNYVDPNGISINELAYIVARIERNISKVISESIKFRTTNELKQMDTRIEDLIQECISSITEGRWGEVLPAVSKLEQVVESHYLLDSMNQRQSELELQQQLSRDVANLEKMRASVQKELDLLQHSKQIIESLDKNNNESKSIVNNIKTNMLDADRLIEEAKSQAIVIKEMVVSVMDAVKREESFIENLEDLNLQSSEMSERIKRILSDVNRDSMAASFRERKEELDESINKSDFFNHSALIAIFLLSITLFAIPLITMFFGKPITGAIDAKFFYERFLIVLPLGFISWFTSRRSQYLFQLREDYAYKYSSAMAFEGYKRQAEMNEEMHNELLKIAITNLGKTPTSIFDRDLKHAPTDKLVDAVKEAIPKIK